MELCLGVSSEGSVYQVDKMQDADSLVIWLHHDGKNHWSGVAPNVSSASRHDVASSSVSAKPIETSTSIEPEFQINADI